MMELQDLSLAGETQLVVVAKLQEIDKHFVELMVVGELLKANTVCNKKVLYKIVNVVERDNTVEQLVITDVDIRSVVNANETIRFMVDRQEITYTVDMFRATLKLPVETPTHPFIAPATLKFIQSFLNIVGYQGNVDNQKKDAIQYPRFTKLIIVDLMKKFASIPQRLEEDYHSIKNDIPLVSVYTTGNVTVKGMLILNEFLTDAIRETQEYKDYAKEFVWVNIPTIQPQPVESTQGTNRTPRAPRTLNPATAVVDDVVSEKKKGERVAGETSSPRSSLKVQIRQQSSFTTTSIPPLSDDRERDEIHEATLSSLTMHKTAKVAKEQENVAIVQEKLLEEDINKMVDKDDDFDATKFDDSIYLNDEEDTSDRIELVSHKDKPESVDNDDDAEEKKDDKKDDNNNDDDHTDHASIKVHVTVVRRLGKRRCRHPFLHPSPRIDLSSNMDINQELTASTSLPPATLSKQSKPISKRYAHILGAIHKMCRRQGIMMQQMQKKFVTNREFQDIKERVDGVLNDIVPKIALNATNDLIRDNLPGIVATAVMKEREALQATTNVLTIHPTTSTSTTLTTTSDLQHQLAKFEKSSSSSGPYKTDAFRKREHDDHHDDDAPPEGEKKSKNWDAWVDSPVIDEDEVIPEDETLELIEEFQNIDKRVPTIYDHERMKATLRDMMIWESRQEDIKRSKPYALVFYGPQRDPNEPLRYLYNKDLFFLKYGNTKEKRYVLSLHKIHDVPFLEDDLEEKINRWVRKEFKTFNEEARLSIQH
ncbi:hypothetical protein Tco_0727260 [Tanacetum coccineum]|uniref:Uncharacterized protein n=1 Tax=Tanacetum coccineum TaxID=301880 RepID=A0ABQ4YHX6_9ASTR